MATKVRALLFLSLVVAAIRMSNSNDESEDTRNTKCYECRDICNNCNKLRHSDHNCLTSLNANKRRTCEGIANELFSKYSICPTVTTTVDPQCPTDTILTTTVSQQNTTTIIIQHTTTITPSPSTCNVKPSTCTPTPNTVTDISSQSSCPCMTAAVNGIQFAAFDKVIVGLLGLSLLLLVVVTTAWVCTCLITKKRKRMMEVTTDDTTDFAEKYFENPTYDGTSMIRIHSKPSQGINRVPVLPVAVRQHQQASSQATFSGAGTTTYDTVNTASPKAAGNGQTYDVLDRGKSNCTARKSARAPKGYSQLDVPDKGVVDNKYHLISKEND